MPIVIALVVILIAFNMCSPREVNSDGSAYRGGGFVERDPPRCNRASCWDDKGGRFIGADEWDKRMKERSLRNE